MKLVEALNDFEAYKGFKVKKGNTYMMDEYGNVYVKKFICQEHSSNFNKNFRIIE